ncbi:Predicted acyltransferase [Daejeonella lutea]|uniref:Predicted acyltransferase n=1 Tax=Daejeonella lutea TaxID=572036 RepID=A0A1T5BZJ8_9SPHI|nr:Predicted acyltransferase [Daejeonella lutea]
MDKPAESGSINVSGAVVNPAMPMNRVASVDVYRGFVMFLMMAEVLSLSEVSDLLPESSFWKIMAFNQSHVEWTWLSLHDMIQPSFTFLVGVVLPYSIASRKNKGASVSRLMLHTFNRSLILILLGIFLRSMHSNQTNYTFEDTLTQIGLGYTFLVLLALSSQRVQLIGLAVILVGYWLVFALYPIPGPDFNYAAAGVKAGWEHNLNGFAAHWNKNTNAAWAFDNWFMNLFPRSKEFQFNRGGYSTLSFIPTLGTMILGLLAGNILNSSRAQIEKVKSFLMIGTALIAFGILLHSFGINPIVKRIWTPSWTVFSGGICFLFLAFFFWMIDISQKGSWSFFLAVIGMNSIAAYCIADGGLKNVINDSLFIHLGQNFDKGFGPYATLVSGGLVLLIEWLILYWMYRRKIFIKV